jgi:hypothetical protein
MKIIWPPWLKYVPFFIGRPQYYIMMYLRAIFGGAIAFVIFTAIALVSPG